jgi:hypothetical protein
MWRRVRYLCLRLTPQESKAFNTEKEGGYTELHGDFIMALRAICELDAGETHRKSSLLRDLRGSRRFSVLKPYLIAGGVFKCESHRA